MRVTISRERQPRLEPSNKQARPQPGVAPSSLQRSVDASARVQGIDAIQRMADRSTAREAPLQRVLQREEKIVAGVTVDVGGGYTNWEGWHLNWRLGGQDKNGNEQYHLTSADRSQHYFFIIDGDTLKDTKPKAHLVPKGKHGGISAAPSTVRDFVMTHFRALM